MLNPKFKLLAATAALFCAATALAQDSQALLDVLIQKGILNKDEAKAIQAEAKKQAASASSTTISGRLYVDFSSISAKTDAGVKVDPSGTGVDVKRFYLGATHKFDKVWSMNINTDSTYSSSTGLINTYIKNAFVQATFSPEAIVQVGASNQPWIPTMEDYYGLRYLENTLTDRLKIGTSADWGIHFLGKSGIVSYNLAAVEGGGYKNPTRSKSMDLEGRLSVEPTKGMVFSIGGYSGDLGKNSNASPTKQTANRFDLAATYTNSKFNVGAEYFSEKNWGITSNAVSDSGDGYSIWGQYYFDKTWSVFGRFDSDKLSKDLHPNMQDHYYNFGVECAAIKGVKISLVYKNDNIDHPTSASAVTNYEEFGVFSEIRF